MDKSDLYGIIGSAIITGLLILLLFLIMLPGAKKIDDEGIMVSFGNTMEGAGMNEQQQATPNPKPVPTPTPPTPKPTTPTTKPVVKDLMTQDNNSVAIAEQKRKEKQEKLERDAVEKKRQEDLRVANEKKQKEQDAINKANAMDGMFGNSNSTGSGNTSGNTNLGNPLGSGSSGGNSWSLNGRSLNGRLVSPNYDRDVEGKVTVNIRVDANGNVTNASIGSPTTISDQTTRNAAVSAAKSTRFSAGNGVATGSITYNFNLR